LTLSSVRGVGIEDHDQALDPAVVPAG